MQTYFLNIDLDLESYEDLTPLAEHWSDDIVVFRLEEADGIWYGAFETSEESENDIVDKYYQLVSQLTTDLRGIWDRAVKRVFDIGFDGGSAPCMYQSQLTQESLAKLVEIGGSITVTIYAPTD